MGLYKGKRTFSGLREEVTTDKEGALPAGSVVIIVVYSFQTGVKVIPFQNTQIIKLVYKTKGT